jgi:thioredoxin-like negative regulator of GroEL
MRATLALVLCLAACTRAPRAGPDAGTPSHSAAPVLHDGIPWYENDLDAALSAARARNVPVLVDLWAPWCHTCLSMRAFVLTARALAPLRDRVVFAALDTERAENAPALSRLPIGAWPTFYVLARDGSVHGRWVGAASAEEFARFVEASLRSVASRDAPRDAALAARVAGDRAMARDDFAGAREAYRRALAATPPDSEDRPALLVALVGALYQLDDADCSELAIAELDHAGSSASATDFAVRALQCAGGLSPGDPRSADVRTQARALLTRLCEQGGPALSADDRGDACGSLASLLSTLGEPGAAARVHSTRLALLDAAAEGLPDAAAHTFDFARAESLLALGRGDEALALLGARERALPEDYSPPHFLARAYRDLGRPVEGLAAVERALQKSAGPRRAGMLGLKADLQLAAGELAAARATLETQLAAYRALPPGQAQPRRQEAVAKRLAELRAPP